VRSLALEVARAKALLGPQELSSAPVSDLPGRGKRAPR
jgi:hypothetical protein